MQDFETIVEPFRIKSVESMDLVRLAIPRRVCTQSHTDYVAEAVIAVGGLRESLRGYRITRAPSVLRHFTALFEPLPA
jgi:tryptophanase